MNPSPFRTRLRTDAEDDLPPSPRWSSAGAAASTSAEHLLSAISDLANDPSQGDAHQVLRRALTHPDERALLTLIQSGLLNLEFPGYRAEVYARAVQDARDEGVSWTPVLDAMESKGVWPFNILGSNVQVPGDPHAEVLVQNPRELLEVSQSWLIQQREPESLVPLAALRSGTLRNLIARRAGGLTAEVVAALFPTPDQWPVLAARLDLPPEVHALLFQGAWKYLRQPADQDTCTTLWSLTRSAEAGRALPRTLVEQVLALLDRVSAGTGNRDLEARGYVVSALASNPSMTPADAHLIFSVIRKAQMSSRYIVRLVENASTPPELLEEIAGLYRRSSTVRLALANRRDSLNLAGVRAALSNSRMPEVLEVLAKTAQPDEFRKRFRKAAAVSPPAAAAALEDASTDQIHSLEQSDLLPLLSGEDQEVRMAAIRAAGRKHYGEQPIPPSESKRRRC